MRAPAEKTKYVPFKHIGRVIGKGGTRIASLADTYNCELQLVRGEALFNGDTPLKIKSLRASYEDVWGVELELETIVSLYEGTVIFQSDKSSTVKNIFNVIFVFLFS